MQSVAEISPAQVVIDPRHQHRDLVPNTDLRELAQRVVETGQFSWSELSRVIWPDDQRPNGKADPSRIKRLLGLSQCKDKKGRVYRRSFMSYRDAVALVRAVGAAPVDFDL